ncbi:MAG: trimeric intracellular cation channel family protein [Spirochaetes bacterium]|nr:trimeric intracellular cation channel family protein [Spirochaetota bacterium]
MEVLYILDLFAVFVSAITGTLAAGKKRMDLFGAFFIAFINAVGGGTTRDVLIGAVPVFWISDIRYLIVIIAASIIAFIFATYILRIRNVILIFDAVGLAVFTVIGIQKALSIGIAPVFAVVMGLVTGVMGGVLRDVFCNDVPLIFSKEIYALACIIGGIVFFMLRSFGLPDTITFAGTIAVIMAVRLVAMELKLGLPRMRLK